VRVLTDGEDGFEAAWREIVDRSDGGVGGDLVAQAAAIVDDVRARGDVALVEQTRRLDRWSPAGPEDLVVGAGTLRAAWEGLEAPLRRALEKAAHRIRRFHEHQAVDVGWEGELGADDGVVVGWRTRPFARAGVYVPGGTAAYPSSVLMNVLPAKVAGVGEVVMVSPTSEGREATVAWAAAHLAGADRVLRLGGAQAVAALAYGTDTVPRCDVVVGPGNAWVAAAKRLVALRGRVAVDMEAGPSEVLIVADGSADPEFVAADLLAQAEHDTRAVPGLILVDAPALAGAVRAALDRRLGALPRADIARGALVGRGFIVHVPDRARAATLADEFAAEHLELLVERPREMLDAVASAGAVFLGPWSPEALGDYLAGPNHVLPTAGTARFSSALGVDHFLRRTSVVEAQAGGLAALAGDVRVLAEAEGLRAHADAVEVRASAVAAAQGRR